VNGEVGALVRSHVDSLVLELTGVIRRQIADDLVAHFGNGGTTVAARRVRQVTPCIAPGCKNASKGPRFHFLCEEHRSAPRKEWELWQTTAREKRHAK
jgi:hypothetical protein